MIIATKPKPPFKPVFQVAAEREGSVVHILNGLEKSSPSPDVFLVETGESGTLPETMLRFLNVLSPLVDTISTTFV